MVGIAMAALCHGKMLVLKFPIIWDTFFPFGLWIVALSTAPSSSTAHPVAAENLLFPSSLT
jgi:hypothetical protein